MPETLLALDRPLVVYDTETTGTNSRFDRIIEIACLKIHPDGRRDQFVRRLNPGVPIPPGSTAIHGITDADVAEAPRFRDVAAELAAFLDGADLGGYNMTGFDLPVLRAEFLRAGVPFDIAERRFVDAQRIFFAREPRHLAAAARFYCQTEHAGAHGALADAEMTLRVLEGQLARYADLPRHGRRAPRRLLRGARPGHGSRGTVPAGQRRADGQLRKEPRTPASGPQPRGAGLSAVDPEGRLLRAGQRDRPEIPPGRALEALSLLAGLPEPQRLPAVGVADADRPGLDLDAPTCRRRRASRARTRSCRACRRRSRRPGDS